MAAYFPLITSTGPWATTGLSLGTDDFLLAAISSTEGIGGKKGAGLGRLQCLDLRAGGQPCKDVLTKLEVIQSLRKLVKGGCEDADPKSTLVA